MEPVIRSGQFPLIGPPPFILGWDISVVIEDSEGVTRFDVGDEVYGMPFFPRAASAYAQYVTAPSRQLARKPPGLSHAEAAALPLAGLAAWQSLVDTARLAAGQRVLIHGAAGGVGHLAVQIAKARGAYVVGTASAAKHEFVMDMCPSSPARGPVPQPWAEQDQSGCEGTGMPALPGLQRVEIIRTVRYVR